MADGTIDDVKGTERSKSHGRRRGQRGNRGSQASGRRPNSPRGGGRAWINGRDVGGPARWSYLDVSYD